MCDNLYFQNYINNLQKDVFLMAFDNGYDIVDFITLYMKSETRRRLDGTYTYLFSQPAIRIYQIAIDEFPNIKKVNKQTTNRDSIEWLGFFYSKWHFMTGESSKTILRFLPVKFGIRRHYVLHQLNEQDAIEMCKRLYNLSRNNHRRYEHTKCIQTIECNPIFYSFLSTRVLYRLLKTEELRHLCYTHNPNDFDFSNDLRTIGVKTQVLYQDDDALIYDAYSKHDLEAKRYKDHDMVVAVFFFFVFSDMYKDEKDLLDDIETFKKEHPANERMFEYVYFYKNGRLYELNQVDELYIYDLPMSKKERNGIIRKMKKELLI